MADSTIAQLHRAGCKTYWREMHYGGLLLLLSPFRTGGKRRQNRRERRTLLRFGRNFRMRFYRLGERLPARILHVVRIPRLGNQKNVFPVVVADEGAAQAMPGAVGIERGGFFRGERIDVLALPAYYTIVSESFRNQVSQRCKLTGGFLGSRSRPACSRGLLRPLRGSTSGLGQPDDFVAGASPDFQQLVRHIMLLWLQAIIPRKSTSPVCTSAHDQH